LFAGGLPRAKAIFRKATARQRIFILMFHRVDYQAAPYFPKPVRPEIFEKQIIFLKKHFEIVDLGFLNKVKAGPGNGKDLVVLTFDDGYRDNYEHAFPVLRKYRVPATVFLATGYIGTGRLLWFNKLAWILYTGSLPDANAFAENDIGANLYEDIVEFFAADAERRVLLLRSMAAGLKDLLPEKRDGFLDGLSRAFKVKAWPGKENRPMLSWEEVREMSEHNISFGSHTVSHPVLSFLSEREGRLEICESKKVIEEKTQKPVKTFAYPYGKTGDYRSDYIFKVLENEGFECACSTNRGAEKFPLSRPLELKRRGVPTDPYLFL